MQTEEKREITISDVLQAVGMYEYLFILEKWPDYNTRYVMDTIEHRVKLKYENG